MTRYTYKAVNQAGCPVKGELDAQSQDHANELISAKGLTVVELRESTGAKSGAQKRWSPTASPVHPEELILFTKQLATMLRAGIPVMRAFDILESQTENLRLKRVCGDVTEQIRGGASLHSALRRHPDVFNRLYTSMVLAGETSGALPQILQRLIYVISHEYKVRTEIRSVLQYPIIVLVCLVIAFVLLVVLVIPRFAAVYERAEVTLPVPTLICIWLSDFMRGHWLAITLFIIALIALVHLAWRTRQGRYWIDRSLLVLPMVGPLLVKGALSRFASVFSILQATGVGILDSLEMLAETIGNAAIGRELVGVQAELEGGHGIAQPLSRARYFTPMFINMVAIGEEAGNLDEMLKEISTHYDAEVEYATRRLTTAMGPFLIVMLAVIVGFFALAIYLPMWDMARVVMGSG